MNPDTTALLQVKSIQDLKKTKFSYERRIENERRFGASSKEQRLERRRSMRWRLNIVEIQTKIFVTDSKFRHSEICFLVLFGAISTPSD